jgi:multiple antibiotic resistance protein
MISFLRDFVVTLSAIFIVVDPFPVAPMFAAMTAGQPAAQIRRTARRAAAAGTLLLLFFAFFGPLLFRALRLDLGAFRAAGGLLLLLTAVDMLRARVSECRCSAPEVEAGAQKDDIAIVPLATPMLAGPGAIATVMVLTSERSGVVGMVPVVGGILLTFTASYLVLRAGPLVARVLGTSGLAMLQRVMGLLLAAIAVQFIAEGGRRLLGLS